MVAGKWWWWWWCGGDDWQTRAAAEAVNAFPEETRTFGDCELDPPDDAKAQADFGGVFLSILVLSLSLFSFSLFFSSSPYSHPILFSSVDFITFPRENIIIRRRIVLLSSHPSSFRHHPLS